MYIAFDRLSNHFTGLERVHLNLTRGCNSEGCFSIQKESLPLLVKVNSVALSSQGMDLRSLTTEGQKALGDEFSLLKFCLNVKENLISIHITNP